MQGELDPTTHQILGVNEVGRDQGNSSITEGRDLPWLQDTADADVWTVWGVEYRDVVVLDADGNVHGVYNVTDNDLGEGAAYDELLELILSAG
jgi:hypothetical protein